ncbi:MAG: hypothetical protein MZV63_29620 [Marinilabiliales bacterium]|nr:hypothetical protein [Marinilabiliales bacterium]
MVLLLIGGLWTSLKASASHSAPWPLPGIFNQEYKHLAEYSPYHSVCGRRYLHVPGRRTVI